MKSIPLILALLLSSTVTADTVDPVVSEYQTLNALRKTYPQLAAMVTIVNGETASNCNTVLPISELVKFERFNLLSNYVSHEGVFSDSELAEVELVLAIAAICTSILDDKYKTVVEHGADLNLIEREIEGLSEKSRRPDLPPFDLHKKSSE